MGEGRRGKVGKAPVGFCDLRVIRKGVGETWDASRGDRRHAFLSGERRQCGEELGVQVEVRKHNGGPGQRESLG